ncbi:MAG: DUF3189 family protein [Bacillota bacterium]
MVYHCYGGAHASPTAAAIHLGILDPNQLPKWKDFQRVPYFDQMTSRQHGKLLLIGEDRLGNEVYVLGRRNAAKLVITLIKEFQKLSGGDPEEYYFVDCVQLFNPFMVTGGFSSRVMGWVDFGRPLVTFGTIISFPLLALKVKKTIDYLESRYRLAQ